MIILFDKFDLTINRSNKQNLLNSLDMLINDDNGRIINIDRYINQLINDQNIVLPVKQKS